MMLLALLLAAAPPPPAPLGYDPPNSETPASLDHQPVARHDRPAPPPPPPPTRISTLVVYGKDPCPRSAGDEIVVCARQPESERYRIPRQLRPKPYNAARDGSWAGTAKVLEMVSREGLPNSCNPIGSNGQSGCFAKFLAENGRYP